MKHLRRLEAPPSIPTVESLAKRVHRELPHLAEAEAADLARVTRTLVEHFRAERIYVFGSQVRGEATWHSDVDLLIVVPAADAYPHHLDQAARRALGGHLLPLDLVFISRDEFAWRAEVVASLAATAVREGRLLYAAPTAPTAPTAAAPTAA